MDLNNASMYTIILYDLSFTIEDALKNLPTISNDYKSFTKLIPKIQA